MDRLELLKVYKKHANNAEKALEEVAFDHIFADIGSSPQHFGGTSKYPIAQPLQAYILEYFMLRALELEEAKNTLNTINDELENQGFPHISQKFADLVYTAWCKNNFEQHPSIHNVDIYEVARQDSPLFIEPKLP